MEESKDFILLLYRLFSNTASEEELSLVEQLLKEKKYRKTFETFKRLWNMELHAPSYKRETDGAYHAYLRYLQKQHSIRSNSGYAIQHIAGIVACVVLVLGSLLYYHYLLPVATPSYSYQAISNNNGMSMTPGHRAVLVLQSGEEVSLSDSSQLMINSSCSNLKNTDGDYSLTYSDQPQIASNRDSGLIFNELIVPCCSEYSLVLADGTKVKLNSCSKLRYPVQFDAHQRVVELDGEAYFEVTKDADCPFIVSANACSVKVLGTSFNVRSYRDNKETVTTLVEGAVSLSDFRGSHLLLHPNHQAIYNCESGKFIEKEVDVDIDVAWTYGRFSFCNTPLSEVFNTISRWYGIEYEFANSGLMNRHLTGSVRRYEHIDKLLELITKTNAVTFVKKGNRIIINGK